jgi:hypothetical protein
VTAGVCAALLLSGPAALAGPAAQQAPHAQHKAPAKGCLEPGETGFYLSKEGSAKVTFMQPFLDGLQRAGVTLAGIAPVEMVDDGTAVMPIGDKVDNIEFPSGRVCYPGGFRLTQQSTGKVYELEDFWVQFAIFGNSKFFATPKVNGVPSAAGELTMLNFSVSQAFTTGEIAPHNGGIGPKRVEMSMDAQWARHLNTELGTDFTDGMPLFELDIAWKGAPTKPFPNTGLVPSPGVAALQAISDAIRPYL